MSATPATESFRPDVFRAHPPALFGSACTACGKVAFPPRSACPDCGAGEDLQATRELSAKGTVYSFTEVHQAPPGLPVPFLLSYVTLDSDNIRLIARLEGFEPPGPVIGTPVRLAAAFIDGEDVSQLKFAFRPQ